MATPQPDDKRGSKRPSERPGGPESLVGMLLSGRYLVERLLGEGGMGAVYLAEHTHMRKKLAVKVLHPEMSRLPEMVSRFEREAMAAAHIDHPNVAAATDFGKLDDGSFFLVLEYVEGTSLRQAIQAGRLELGRALHIVRQVAAGLGRAHALKIVHRDLKPENVMLVARDEDPDFVKVLDFGIAKVPVGELSAGSDSAAPAASAVALTRVGMVFGTPQYMAPEQAMGQTVDGRADLYSLGIVAFEMLTGRRPFEHDNAATLLAMQITAHVPLMATRAPEADVPPEVEAIVFRLLEKDQARRFADAKELVSTVTAAMCDLAARGRIDTAYVDRAGTSSSVSLRSLQPAPTPPPKLVASVPTTKALSVADIAEGYARRLGRRGMLGVAAGGALVLAVMLHFLLASRAGPVTPDGSARSDAVVQGPAPSETQALEKHLASAEASLQRGDPAGAIAELTTLEKDHPGLPALHRDLEQAYLSSGDPRAAIREAQLWLEADPKAAADPRLQEDLRGLAAGHEGGSPARRVAAEDEEAAIALLEASMGTFGPDVLYDLAYGAHPAPGPRAHSALTKPQARDHASPALLVTLDLRAASGCDARRALLERARQMGDARTVAILRTYKPTSGCGFLSMGDCWPCLHRDASLGRAIEEIEGRLGTP